MLSKSYVKSRNICKVTFTIPQDELPKEMNVQTAAIVADFNAWSMVANPMEHVKGVGFQITLELDPNKRYEYRYLLNDVEWYNDWAADSYTPNRLQNADNCVISLEGMVEDNLTKVLGIGPKVAGLLKADGITSFAALSAAPLDQIQGILDKAGKRYQIIVPTTWPEQARYLAAGDAKGLAKYQATLDGGRPA